MSAERLRAGDFDRRIQIFKPTTIENELGQLSGADVLVATVWAQYVEKLFTKVEAEREAISATEYFLIRWRNDVDETMSIVHDGIKFEIDRIAEYGRRVGLKLYVRSVR